MLKQRVPLWSLLFVLGCIGGLALASRNSGGTYSLPAGNPVVTGTTITSTWANTTLNDIKTELTNSLDRQGRGGMLAPLQLVAGSSAAPSMSWSLEPGSGPYRAGAGDIRWSVLGTPVLKLQSALVSTLVPLTVTGRTTTTDLTVTGTSKELVIVSASGIALTATGEGAGSGVLAVGGATNGVGVVGIGSGTGTGVYARGSPSGVGIGLQAFGGNNGGDGLQASAAAGSYNGITSVGSGTGVGIQGTGGATSGRGLYGIGGSPNGVGIYGVSSGTGSGIYGAAGASGGAAIEAANAVVATGAVRQDAIRAGGGDINLNGTANATATTAMLNRLAPNNIIKAWGTFKIAANNASVTLLDGFNIASVALANNNVFIVDGHGNDTVDVVFASGLSGSDYAVTTTTTYASCAPQVFSSTTNSAQVSFVFGNTYSHDATGKLACAQTATTAFTTWTGSRVTFLVIGAQ